MFFTVLYKKAPNCFNYESVRGFCLFSVVCESSPCHRLARVLLNCCEYLRLDQTILWRLMSTKCKRIKVFRCFIISVKCCILSTILIREME